MTAFDLSGQTALVTGGATGIGAAICAALASAGANVAVTVHTRTAGEVRATVEGLGRRFHEVKTDLSTIDQDDASAIVADVEATLGPLAILVNNAGTIRRSDAVDTADDDWDYVINTNLDSVWRLSQAAGRVMLPRASGKIVTIASLLSFQGGIRVPAYAAAKHAVAGLTKALANEWAGRGVNVNAVAPGYIETTNTEALRADAKRSADILARIPAGRWGQAEDIAGAVVFLSSRAASYVHGQILAVDGGWMAR